MDRKEEVERLIHSLKISIHHEAEQLYRIFMPTPEEIKPLHTLVEDLDKYCKEFQKLNNPK